jgi:hypothetical protein
VFTASGDLVAVMQERVRGLPLEDDALNNLWRYRGTGQGWERLTDFRADRDRWSVLRTPQAAEDGSVLFVRVTGRASATKQPNWALWRWSSSGAAKVFSLPGEMYLAGFRDGEVLWNAPSESCGDWGVFETSHYGRLRQVACGAVSVDPLATADPDASIGSDEASSAPRAAGPSRASIAVVVGDFASEADALNVLDRLPAVEGMRVVDHRTAPSMVRPDFYVIVLPVGKTPPGQLLRRIRRALPATCVCQAWISSS